MPRRHRTPRAYKSIHPHRTRRGGVARGSPSSRGFTQRALPPLRRSRCSSTWPPTVCAGSQPLGRPARMPWPPDPIPNPMPVTGYGRWVAVTSTSPSRRAGSSPRACVRSPLALAPGTTIPAPVVLDADPYSVLAWAVQSLVDAGLLPPERRAAAKCCVRPRSMGSLSSSQTAPDSGSHRPTGRPCSSSSSSASSAASSEMPTPPDDRRTGPAPVPHRLAQRVWTAPTTSTTGSTDSPASVRDDRHACWRPVSDGGTRTPRSLVALR